MSEAFESFDFGENYFLEHRETDEDIQNMLPYIRGTRLCRYAAEKENAVSACEQSIAEFTGARYALAVNSGTSAIYLALYALGVRAGDEVLLPGLTFVSVPGAVVQMGAIPVLVDITENYTVDLVDLESKITARTKAVLITHMRSMITDMRELKGICAKRGISLVEDCAHSMGAYFDGTHMGRFGSVGCFSTQSKLLNSGEGGLVITDSPDLMARMILLSGCYGENYTYHSIEKEIFEKYRFILPCFGMRMSCLNAGYMLPFLHGIAEKSEKYRRNYGLFYEMAHDIENIGLPQINSKACPCTNCIMFRFVGLDRDKIGKIREWLKGKGLVLTGYIDEGNCRFYRNWRYIQGNQALETADRVLKDTYEFVLPGHFEAEDIQRTVHLLRMAIAVHMG